MPKRDVSGLATFLAVAEVQSFRAAASELGVTTSAVSQAIQKLERQVGLQLFTRTTRSVALTDAGRRLDAGLRPAFRDVDRTIESLRELRGKPSGRLRLSVYSVAESFLSDGLLSAFLAEYPDIQLEIQIDDSDTDQRIPAKLRALVDFLRKRAKGPR